MTEPAPIIHFTIERTWIQPGDCVRLRWSAEGAEAVYFYPEGQPWQDCGVVAIGEQEVCPEEKTTYCLRVVKRDGSVKVKQRTVQVRARRAIELFAADRAEIQPGECVIFAWRVEGAKAVYFHPEDLPWHDRAVWGTGQQEVCPSETTTYCLRVVKRDDSLEIQKAVLQVRS